MCLAVVCMEGFVYLTSSRWCLLIGAFPLGWLNSLLDKEKDLDKTRCVEPRPLFDIEYSM